MNFCFAISHSRHLYLTVFFFGVAFLILAPVIALSFASAHSPKNPRLPVLIAANMASSAQEAADNRQKVQANGKEKNTNVAPQYAEYGIAPTTSRNRLAQLLGSSAEAIPKPSFADMYRDNAGSAAQICEDDQDGQQLQSSPAVRFKSTIEEIAPDNAMSTITPSADGVALGDPGEVTPDQIRDLSNRLRACPLQERRMNIFSYEAFSLPPSRVRALLLLVFGRLAIGTFFRSAFFCRSRAVAVSQGLCNLRRSFQLYRGAFSNFRPVAFPNAQLTGNSRQHPVMMSRENLVARPLLKIQRVTARRA
jgi:hypothetical protein